MFRSCYKRKWRRQGRRKSHFHGFCRDCWSCNWPQPWERTFFPTWRPLPVLLLLIACRVFRHEDGTFLVMLGNFWMFFYVLHVPLFWDAHRYIYIYINIYVVALSLSLFFHAFNLSICIYIYTSPYIYLCINTYTYIYIYMYVCIYVYMYRCIYVYMYICIYVFMCVCIYVFIFWCIYVYM